MCIRDRVYAGDESEGHCSDGGYHSIPGGEVHPCGAPAAAPVLHTPEMDKQTGYARKGEGKICPHPFYLLSLTLERAMNREFQKSGDSGEGRLSNF